MSEQRTKVAVIIVTYNAVRFIPDCFGSLAGMNRTGLDVDILVIDNGSKDASVEMLKAYPHAEVIVSPTNLGFAGGNNLAMRMAMDRGAEFVYLLNHDTEITPDFLVKAVAAAKADPKVGSVQSLLLLSPSKDLVNSTGNAIHFLGFGYCLDYKRKADDVRKQYADKRPEIAYGSGAGVLFRCELLKKIGLLDEELFLYHEDLDLGWRVRLAGFKNVFMPESVIYHKYEFSRSISKYYYMERNRYVVFLKNLRLWSLVVLLPFMIFAELGLLPASFRSGWWKEKLRSYGYFFLPSTWKRIANERRAMAKLRAVSDREIVRLWSSTISYQEVAGTFTRCVANPLMTLTWTVIRNLIV